MTAPPTVVEHGDESGPGLESLDEESSVGGRPTVVDFDDSDPHSARIDPASDVVAIGEIPPLTAPIRPERRKLPPMPSDRLRGWITTIVLTIIGGLTRIWNVGSATDGGTPLFDEKYYAVQAAEVIRNNGVEDNQAYGVVVHPPLGKQLIALGEKLVGYNPTGWRLASVVAGTVVVFLTIRVVRRMTRSTLLGAIGGILIICDGVSFVMSRMALLDVFQEVFILAAFACLIADRDQTRARLNSHVHDTFLPPEPGTGPFRAWRRWGDVAGPALGARWWRFGCGFFMGLTFAIKYNGVYWIVAFGLLSVFWDITARRELGVRRPVIGALRRDVLPSIWSLVVVPFGIYIASWWAWFFSENAYPRHAFMADPSHVGDWANPTGLFHKLASLWHNALWQWTWKMLDFHANLLTPSNPADRHPWESKPWSWPIGTRPVLYYAPPAGQTGCGAGRTDCVERIFIIGTPALWWLSLFVLVWALWRTFTRFDWRYAAVLVAYGADYLPWFTNLNRQMYFFYVTPLAPFLIIGICLVLGDILGRRHVGIERRYLSYAIVALYVGLVVANFIWLLPMLDGSPMTPERLTAETWLPSWG
ncbi:Dolichyl-phosphate-mannose-protein mannosyltransferase [Nakamurella panacisegetis]|uniref:Polyprenol-phosphate-mannose--protein mannosyltransferase n=1 Tax=Nakamurella panacisegetis TaxID=1090615 RepID=A0A1H0IMS3_9ACTN|nr:glycosyltransferase family 39 protein [Nakamurella panacisegetis]SDO32697.1 Dolichyl-phosphate-mannose-protein mannosyltransferase [Nakamurella panacisegetis]